MMKIKSIILTCVLAAAVSSCSTINHTATTSGVNSNIYNLTVADLKVSEQKVEKTAEWKWNPLSSVSLGEQKKTAEAELLKEANADVLVEPEYEVTRRGFMRGGSVTVSGYPATYRNFRPMSEKDAMTIATLDGKIGVACYPIQTTGHKAKKRKVKPMFAPKPEFTGRSFAALVGGPVFDVDDAHFDTGVQLGAMYGNYGRKWGWYGKLLWQNAKGNNSDADVMDGGKTLNGFVLTVGAIKTLSRYFNFLFGTGASTGYVVKSEGEIYHDGNGYGYSQKYEKCFAVPVEVGFQWSNRKVTALVGCTGQITTGTTNTVHVSPFIGIGYNF